VPVQTDVSIVIVFVGTVVHIVTSVPYVIMHVFYSHDNRLMI